MQFINRVINGGKHGNWRSLLDMVRETPPTSYLVRAGFDSRFSVSVVNLCAKSAPTTSAYY
ncbi:hypothetical protein [Chroococcidiopsis sp.]|uniref:hypothetical protein n=1 Tax=Chroococcidiopsis sp. TaxID=3088168 RepID=UPI003F3053A4